MPTIDENPEVSVSPDSKVCPHCNRRIEWMDYSCDYTEWGRAYGKSYPCGDQEEEDRNYSDGETNEYEYHCPECEGDLDYNFFEDDDAEEGEEEEADKPAPVIINQETNSECERLVNRDCPECHFMFQDIVDDPVDACVKCGYVFPAPNN